MCKILIIPHVPKNKVENLWTFVTTVALPLCKNDGDGFGYMALDSKGNLGIEKWVDPKEAFRVRGSRKSDATILERYQGVLSLQNSYSKLGDIVYEDIVSIALHARKATCGVSILNTHPFINEEKTTALIHNGIVDTDNLTLKSSTCDSEGILNAYDKFKVNLELSHIKSFAKNVKGNYACGVFSKTIEDKWILDIIKDDAQKLSAVHVKELGGLVFCTDINIVIAVCKVLKWKVLSKFNIKTNSVIRLDPYTGNVLQVTDFTPTKRYTYISHNTHSTRQGNNYRDPYNKYSDDEGYGGGGFRY